MTKMPWRHRYVRTNGIVLHIVEAGPTDGPLVILLHGFPEFWWSWRQQIPALAAAGYRVVAMDQRGYFLSEKPTGVENYTLPVLAADIAGLITVYGRESCFLVGHDFAPMSRQAPGLVSSPMLFLTNISGPGQCPGP